MFLIEVCILLRIQQLTFARTMAFKMVAHASIAPTNNVIYVTVAGLAFWAHSVIMIRVSHRMRLYK